MIEVKIYPQFIGRLGNNLFQIAACIGFAAEHNCGWGIRKGYIERGFNVDQVDRFLPWLPETHAQFRAYNEPYFNFAPIPYDPQGTRIVGFFQSEKYFQNAKDEVKKWIKVPEDKHYRDYCSIHVRRGDYVIHSGSFPPVTVDYIQRAMFALKRGRYMVFSDDIPWCKENLGHLDTSYSQIEFHEGHNEWEDLTGMANCSDHICSNSTLSWWGCWLGKNPEKQVVCPHHLEWFGKSNPNWSVTFDLYPRGWQEIQFR